MSPSVCEEEEKAVDGGSVARGSGKKKAPSNIRENDFKSEQREEEVNTIVLLII